MSTVQIARNIREENQKLSDGLRKRFDCSGIRVIGLLGSPGSGKTTLLENLLPLFSDQRVAVIEGDIATENDAQRVRALGVKALQIQTAGACHLDASMLEQTLNELELTDYDLLFVENVGNLVCPVSFPLGETLRLAVISAAEGEDKPQKYPGAILHTDALIITKVDLAPYTKVNPERMAEYARQINPQIRVFFTGMDEDGQYAFQGGDLSAFVRG